jgi:hypothetical protein
MASFVPLRVLRAVAQRRVIIPVCSMHENPYIERHKEKRKVSEGFKKKVCFWSSFGDLEVKNL